MDKATRERHAKSIVENPLWDELREVLVHDYYQKWRQADPGSFQRDYWGLAHDCVDDVISHIMTLSQATEIEQALAQMRAPIDPNQPAAH